LFIRAAALALVYLFIGIDDLMMRPSGLDDLLKSMMSCIALLCRAGKI
jgi:hypothetical protein